MDCEEPEKMSKQDLDDSGCVQDALSDSYKGQVSLLDLCDDVLLYILKLCSPQDLKALGHTCPRLGSLVCDHTLWTSVDCRSASIGQRRLRWLLTHCLTDATNELQIKGFVNNTGQKCMGLNQEIPGSQCRIYDDPGVCTRCPFWPENIEAMRLNAKNSIQTNSGKSTLLNLSSKPDASLSSNDSCLNFDDFNQNSDLENAGSLNSDTNARGVVYCNDSSVTECGKNVTECGKDATECGKNVTECGKNVTECGTSANKHNCPGPCFTLNNNLLLELSARCIHLTSLSLEYCNIDYLKTKIRQFPPKLKKLSLRGSRIFNLPYRTSFLCKMNGRLPDLEYLDVSECDWFEPSSLMPLSKLSRLCALRMRACARLAECVAYASLAARYGFKELKVIDIRDTLLADSEISALGWLPKLEELYACPPPGPPSTDVHTHTLLERSDWQELSDWEIAEPDYYKNKVPEPFSMEEEERIEDIMPPPTDPWPNERIIVIPGPIIHQRRTTNDPRDENRGPINLSPNRPTQGTRRPNEQPTTSQDTRRNGEESTLSDEDEPKAKKTRVCESDKNGESTPGTSANGESQRSCEETRRESGEGSSQSGEDSCQSGEGSSHSGESRQVNGGFDVTVQPVIPPNGEQPRYVRFRRRANIEDLITNRHVTHGRNTINVHDIVSQMGQNVTNYGEAFSITVQDQFALGPNLVTDLAVMRFGRADNDNINYVNIGRNEGLAMPNEVRPERSSLRILSLTGYRHISDRSLVHLATAAPNLVNIDFSRTNVSERGVSMFKAMRSECDVVFSKYEVK